MANEKKQIVIKGKYKLKPLYVLDSNFTQIANTMFRYIPNGNDFKVYCYLCFRYNRKYQYAFPSLSTIASETCLSLSTVQRSIKWLEQKRFIVRYKKAGEEWCNNCYYVRYVVEDIDDIQNQAIEKFEQLMGDGFEGEIIVAELLDEEEIIDNTKEE